VNLNPVAGGPFAGQWALLAVVVAVAAGWLVAGSAAAVRRRRAADRSSTLALPPSGRAGRRITTAVAAVGALAALVTVAAIGAPDSWTSGSSGGWRSAAGAPRVHLPLAVTLLAVGLAALLAAGALRRWWTADPARDAASPSP
jgi:hypothetical protein